MRRFFIFSLILVATTILLTCGDEVGNGGNGGDGDTSAYWYKISDNGEIQLPAYNTPLCVLSSNELWTYGWGGEDTVMYASVARYDDGVWTKWYLIGNSAYAWGVYALSPDDVWASAFNIDGYGGLYHFNGSSWNLELETHAYTLPGPIDFWDSSHGVMFSIFMCGDEYYTTGVWTFDGTSWTEHTYWEGGPIDDALFDASMASQNVAYAISDFHYIYKYDNGSISHIIHSSDTYDIEMVSTTLGWLCCDDGLYKLDGSNWIKQTDFPGEKAISASFVSPDLGWVLGRIGTEGYIYRYENGTFYEEPHDRFSEYNGGIGMYSDTGGFIYDGLQLLSREANP